MRIPLTRTIKKSFPIALTLLCMMGTLRAQTSTCPIRLAQLKAPPELLELRLGMTFEEVKAPLPVVEFGPPDEFGVVKTTVNPLYDSRLDPAIFNSVRTISLDFLDGKLVRLWIGFENGFKWPKLDEFVTNFSRALDVPADWPINRTGRQLNCNGFSLFASIIAGGPNIRVTDEQAQALIADRREEAFVAAEAQVIGNSRTKIYYVADCAARDEVPALYRTIFKNKAEAETAGYKPAKECE